MSTVVDIPDHNSPRGHVAAEVRAELARARISGNRLAQMLGQSQRYWSRRLTGQVAMDVDDLGALAELLGVPMTHFVATADTQNPRQAGPDGGFGPVSPALRARRDSNPQPSDPYSIERNLESTSHLAPVIGLADYRELRQAAGA